MHNQILHGKTAIITGARGGIGKATVKLFAENGARIYACVRKQDDDFLKYCSELEKKYNISCTIVCFDMLDSMSMRNAIKKVLGKEKNIDILVNNAGVAATGTLRTTSISSLKNMFDINFFSQIEMTQLISSKMIKNKIGSIINIASVGGIEAQPGYLPYGSSKAALIWTTKSLSRELGVFNIRVNAVAPGQTMTSMGGAFKTEEEMEKVLERTPLGRMAYPEEIANAILFLASDYSSYITGEILKVDGGRA